MNERKIAKATIDLEFEDGKRVAYEVTGTDAVPMTWSYSWNCDPVRDFAAEAEQGSAWMIHRPGPRTDITVSVSGVARNLVAPPESTE